MRKFEPSAGQVETRNTVPHRLQFLVSDIKSDGRDIRVRTEKTQAAEPAHGGRRAATAPAASGTAGGTLGRGQRSTAPDIDADIDAIHALCTQVTRVWDGLTASTREELAVRMELLSQAADLRETDSPIVRGALQEVLLIVGTGALATLNGGVGRRLTVLTGIALPQRDAT